MGVTFAQTRMSLRLFGRLNATFGFSWKIRLSFARQCVSACERKHFHSNDFSSETIHWILTKLQRNDPYVFLYQICSSRSSWLHK